MAIRKTCNKCFIEKDLDEFHRDSYTNDGHATICKICKSSEQKKYRKTHRKQLRVPINWLLECKKCHKLLPISQFYANGSQKYASYCKTCTSINNRSKQHQEQRRDYEHNLLCGQYKKILESQMGKCFICGYKPATKGRPLCVDHDHITGAIRGLLCDNCNHGIGNFKDSVDLLKQAIRYLEKYNGQV